MTADRFSSSSAHQGAVDVTLIVPAYNEAAVIAGNIEEILAYVTQAVPDRSFELIAIDDGSTDETAAVLAELAAREQRLRLIRHPRNLGRGAALRNAFKAARGTYIITLDADLSYAPEHIPRLLAPLESGQADIVLASAYHAQGRVENVPPSRAFTSRLGNLILSFALNRELKTVTCIVRGYNREAVDSLALFANDKEIHLEAIQKAFILGLTVVEIPAVLKWRSTKRSLASRGSSPRAFFRTVSSHLFYNFLYRPEVLTWPPITILLIFLAIFIGMIIFGLCNFIAQAPPPANLLGWISLLRDHVLFASVTYLMTGLCLLLLFQFLSMVFIAKQNNHFFREMFSYLTEIRKQLRENRGE